MKRTPYGAAKAFLENALRTDTESCINWPFTVSGGGNYGSIKINGQHRRVNRVVCSAVHGPPPSSTHEAAHNCGNSLCINHKHLRWATPAENTQDKFVHGTVLSGQDNPHAKLSEDDVRTIRSLRKTMTVTALGTMFGVSAANISLITTGRGWRSVT